MPCFGFAFATRVQWSIGIPGVITGPGPKNLPHNPGNNALFAPKPPREPPKPAFKALHKKEFQQNLQNLLINNNPKTPPKKIFRIGRGEHGGGGTGGGTRGGFVFWVLSWGGEYGGGGGETELWGI